MEGRSEAGKRLPSSHLVLVLVPEQWELRRAPGWDFSSLTAPLLDLNV